MLTDKNFIDWENHIFGYGYGTGEQYTLKALKDFVNLLEKTDYGSWNYNYEKLERGLTPTVAWLMINILCKCDILEYGTSPRYAWLDHTKGILLKEYLDGKTVDELYELVMATTEDSVICYPDYCNCEINDIKRCNPLFN